MDHIQNPNLGQNPAIYAAGPQLPFDIITEILSWLPVESLLRFKCVCKQWRSLLLDYKFIAKHMLRAEPLQISYQRIWEPNKQTYLYTYDENFESLTFADGLFLERSLITSPVYRIRNFATRQVLYLPGALNSTNPDEEWSFVFDSSTGECKVACFYANNYDLVEIRVLSIGKDEEWRTLKQPSPSKRDEVLSRFYFGTYPDKRVVDLVEIIRVGEDLKLEIVTFDVWSECFTVNTLPQGVFTDWHKVCSFCWNNSIAVSDIVGEALEVLVLQSFKEHKWSKTTVPLKFLRDDPVLKDQIQPVICTGDGLKFENSVRNNAFEYDMKRGVIIMEADTLPKSTQKKVCSITPSLAFVKGMKSEYC